jgi:hypothetical protein
MPGKTPIWENPKRERDFISFRKDISTTTIHLQPREITYNTQQSQIFALKSVPRRSVLLYGFALFEHLEICTN